MIFCTVLIIWLASWHSQELCIEFSLMYCKLFLIYLVNALGLYICLCLLHFVYAIYYLTFITSNGLIITCESKLASDELAKIVCLNERSPPF